MERACPYTAVDQEKVISPLKDSMGQRTDEETWVMFWVLEGQTLTFDLPKLTG